MIPCESAKCQGRYRDPECEFCGGLYPELEEPMAFESENRHECLCQRHDCRVRVRCSLDEMPAGNVQFRCADSRYVHICEDCASDPACNGADLNPGYAEDEHSFLGPKL